jgi:hypothetical protein
VRRFSFVDNSTSYSVVQYLTNFSVRFHVAAEGQNQIEPPLFELEQAQIRRHDIVSDSTLVRLTEQTLTHIPFSFQVLYSSDCKGT